MKSLITARMSSYHIIISLFFILMFVMPASVAAEQVGKFSYKGSLFNFKNPGSDTIFVNDTMVAMAEKIFALTRFFTDSIPDTPAIFFIIDHSTSMSYAFGDNSNDRWGNRFRVTSAFMDSIFKKFPTAEIGYAVFKAELYFVADDSPYFHRYGTTDGAYLPLYKLNQLYQADSGITILKRFLETDTAVSPGGNPIQYAELRYRPSLARTEGTNINIGFESAIDAFSSTTKSLASRYVIFLSDGEANAPRGQENNFVAGTNVPTTFTVFFTRDNTTPQSIVNMTNNIITLGFPKSSYWPFYNTTFDQLMLFLRDSIYTKIASERRGQPITLTINAQTIGNWQDSDSSFNSASLFPLIGPVTPFSSIFTYNLYENEVVVKDTTDTVNFFVKRATGTPMPETVFDKKYWDRYLSFFYNNTLITVANETMDSIEIRFTFDPGSALYNYTNIQLALSNAKAPLDSESITLTNAVTYFTGKFKREISTTPTALNGVLEHDTINDTIIARFWNTENPALPLDTLRVPLLFNLTTNRLLEIRLFDLRDLTTPLDSIVMTTDQSMVVVVQGKWSRDTTQWVEVPGIWSMVMDALTPQFARPLPTTASSQWLCDPVTSGQTLLTVVSADSANVTVPVIITEAGPSNLRLVLLTHPDSCFAGEPLKIGAYIENTDGPVDGTWSGTSVYRDILDNSVRAPWLPWMTINGRMTPDSLDKPAAQTWLNGADTLSLTLYYAPLSNDSLHQIHLTLNGTLQANTIKFKLRPGPIDSVQIEDQPGTHLMTEIVLTYPTGSVTLYARGFDKYGNRLVAGMAGGDDLYNVVWRGDGTLHPPLDSIGPNVFYSAANVLYPENGNMWAVLFAHGDTLKDWVPIRIIPPPATLVMAITRDKDGNGFIDRIEVGLSKKIALTGNDHTYFQMRYPSSPDPSTSNMTTNATAITLINDSTYAIDFAELSNPRFPQTGWKPFLIINQNPYDISTTTALTSDGCPPVLWRVEKHLNRNSDRTKDTVFVFFSEKIVGTDGATFKASELPIMTFNVWTRDSSAGTFTLHPEMLDVNTTAVGTYPAVTSYLRSISNDSAVCFLMTNGRDLYNIHWLNIKTSPAPSPVLKDKQAGNIPDSVNHKVQVIVLGNYEIIQIIPNPSKGTLVHEIDIGGGTISSVHIPNARTWVKNERAGTVISISNIRVPNGYIITDPETFPKGYIKIYDVVGNTVNFVEIPNWLAAMDVSTGSGLTVDLYWTGANAKRMMVAPGVYRVVAYVDYPSNQKDLKDKRLIVKAGITN